MKKINQIATINDVSLNDKLKEWNEENEAFRVQLRIAYSADDSKDEEDDDLLSLADFEEAGASVGKTYTCLINFDSLLTDKHTEKEQDKALAKLVEKFKGKKARFSTFDFTISELTDGKEKAINDGTHTYSSLANTYLGSVEDEESEFNKLKIVCLTWSIMISISVKLTKISGDGDWQNNLQLPFFRTILRNSSNRLF